MLRRATAAASNAWHECETCPGEMYVKEARIIARAALLAALDPEDEALVQAVIAKLDYTNPYKEDVAGNILWAIRDLMSDATQGETLG